MCLGDWGNHKVWSLDWLWGRNYLLLSNSRGRWLNKSSSWLSHFCWCRSRIDLSRCLRDCSSNSCGINWLAVLLLLLSNLLSLGDESSLNISVGCSVSCHRELFLATWGGWSSLNKCWGRCGCYRCGDHWSVLSYCSNRLWSHSNWCLSGNTRR